MPSQGFQQMVDRAFTDEEFAQRLQTDREKAIAEYDLTDEEKKGLMSIGNRYGPDVTGHALDSTYSSIGLDPSSSDPKSVKITKVLKCSF